MTGISLLVLITFGLRRRCSAPDKLVVFREAMAYTPGDGIPDAAFREPAVTPAVSATFWWVKGYPSVWVFTRYRSAGLSS